jgi:hypothetical protein
MKLPRRRFLHLAAGAAALPAVSRFAWAPLPFSPHYATNGNGEILSLTASFSTDGVVTMVSKQ